MEPSLGSEESFGISWLKKALYGLTQSPWHFGRFAGSMPRMRYNQSLEDYTLFKKHSKNGKLTALCR